MPQHVPRDKSLLILAPSVGFGGGIERMAGSIEASWPGPVTRLDLYYPDEVERPEGNLRAKLRFARRFLVIVLRDRPSRVLALHVSFLKLALTAERLVGARAAMFAIGVEVWVPLSSSTRRAVRNCQNLLAISTFTAEWFARRAIIDPGRVKVVPLPVDSSLAEAAFGGGNSQQNDHASAAISLLTVTRLVPEHRFKGYFNVADAVALLLEDDPGLRWTIAGFGPDLPALKSYCQDLEITHAVNFAGRITDQQLIDLYRQADIFVLPSVADPNATPPIGEGFGLVYAEAGAFGIPAVASSAGGGALEFVIHEETGLTVPPHDPDALLAAIGRLISDPALRAALGSQAAARVRRRHLPATFAEALSASLD